MKSININKICFVGAVALAVVQVASGCSTATSTGGLQRAAEVRAATTLEAGSTRLIVSGPARLLHVDVYGHQVVVVYSVKRRQDGTVDCRSKAQSTARQLKAAASNELNMVVGDDEGICLANAPGTAPRADVSWHAQRGTGASIKIAHTGPASHQIDTKPALRS